MTSAYFDFLVFIGQNKFLGYPYAAIVLLIGVIVILYATGLGDKIVARKENKGF